MLAESTLLVSAVVVYLLQNLIYAIYRRVTKKEFPVNGFILGLVISFMLGLGIFYFDGRLDTTSIDTITASLVTIWGVGQGVYNLSLTVPKFFEARKEAKIAGKKKPLLDF